MIIIWRKKKNSLLHMPEKLLQLHPFLQYRQECLRVKTQLAGAKGRTGKNRKRQNELKKRLKNVSQLEDRDGEIDDPDGSGGSFTNSVKCQELEKKKPQCGRIRRIIHEMGGISRRRLKAWICNFLARSRKLLGRAFILPCIRKDLPVGPLIILSILIFQQLP